jgi:hypothetical protein
MPRADAPESVIRFLGFINLYQRCKAVARERR